MTRQAASVLGRLAGRISGRALAQAPAGFFLLAACCRWPRSPQRTLAIEASGGSLADWPQWLKLVRAHRVWGLAASGIADASLLPPPKLAGTLQAWVARATRSNLALAKETLHLQGLFQQAGLAVVVLKGVSLAILAYNDLSVKNSVDIDLYVPPGEVARAKEVLERAGYALALAPNGLGPQQLAQLVRCTRELGFQSAPKQPLVELHWKLSYNPALLRGISAESALQTVAIGAASIQTLGGDDLFVYLCVHGAQHKWERLKWLADLAALLSSQNGEAIEGLYRAAQRAGAGRCAGQALLLCQRLLELPLPEGFATELRASGMVLVLEALALRAMMACGATKQPRGGVLANLRTSFYLLLLGSGPRFYASELGRYLISPADVLVLPLPLWLSWLYPVLRLPIWLWRWRPWRG